MLQVRISPIGLVPQLYCTFILSTQIRNYPTPHSFPWKKVLYSVQYYQRRLVFVALYSYYSMLSTVHCSMFTHHLQLTNFHSLLPTPLSTLSMLQKSSRFQHNYTLSTISESCPALPLHTLLAALGGLIFPNPNWLPSPAR